MKRIALVTGASRGIGRAIAKRLAAEGCRVAVNYRVKRERAEEVVREIVQAGGEAMAVQADVGEEGAVEEMVKRVRAAMGAVEILVNNAGVLVRGDLSDFDYRQMEPMRRVNVDGLVAVTRAVAPGMKERGWGRIINLTSVAALGTSLAGTTFYAATKAAVIILTKRFALELGAMGITVNAIAPGFIVTDMVGEPVNLAAIAEKAMVKRVGQPEDVAHAAAFLASEGAGFVTGQLLRADGGRTDFLG